MKNIKKALILAMLFGVTSMATAMDKATQDFINSIHFNSKPTKRYMSQLGPVTEYSDGSIKIDNYRGKGGTFHLSGNKKQHIELDSAGNKIRSSADQDRIKTSYSSMNYQGRLDNTLFRHKDGTMERYFSLNRNLHITYPDGICVAFDLDPYTDRKLEPGYCEKFDYLIDSINNIDSEKVINELKRYLNLIKQYPDSIVHLLYLIHQRNPVLGTPLSAAVKRLLMGGLTSQQSSDLIKIIQALLEAGSNPNIADAQGNTPLSLTVKKALMSGLTLEQSQTLIGIIKALLAAGADPTIADAQGNTPITLAATKPDLLQVFMKAGGEQIFPAISKADKNAVMVFLSRMRQKSDINTMKNPAGQTPLVYALTLALQTYNQMKQAQENAAKVENINEKAKWEASARKLDTQFMNFRYIAQALIYARATLNNESGKKFLQDNGTAYRTILSPLLEI